jgi:pimeloyl-ACP methyl ester carboxylesterase
MAAAQAEVLAHWIRTGSVRTEISLVAHSNGCDIARHTAIALADKGIFVKNLILIAAPIEERLSATGLRSLAARGHIRRLSAWASPNDHVLHAPGDPIGAFLRWPYGNLGRAGFTDVKKTVIEYDVTPCHGTPTVYTRWFNWGHGDYFTPANSADTFNTIIEEITTP